MQKETNVTTEVTTTKTPSIGKQLLAEVAQMLPSGDIPTGDRKTTKDLNAQGKKFTPKDKAVLGIPEEMSITWSHPSFDAKTSEQLRLFAKAAGQTVDELLTSVARTWVHENIEAIEDVAGEVVIAEVSVEDVEKQIEASRRKMERLMAALKIRQANV